MITPERLIQKTKVFLLDLDGTLYLDENPIGRVQETLALLRAAGKKLVYCTNNSSKTPSEYVRKLEKIGLWGEGDMVYTSGIAAAEYLKKYRPKERVYALATDEVKADLAARGVPLDEENPDVCLLAYDTSLTFAKMKKFNEFLCAGKFYAATHPDAVCPALPCPMPDVGSFIEMFRVSSGRTPDVVCGKPCPVMGEGLESLLGVEKGEVAMVGDRLHTDIRFANCSGFTAVLVLSGETTAEMAAASADRPDIVLKAFNNLLPLLAAENSAKSV